MLRPALLAAVVLSALAAGCADDEEPLPSPVGVYELDRKAYVRSLLGPEPDEPPEDEAARKARRAARAEAHARAQGEAARLDVQLALEADGSFVVRYRFGKEEGRYRGTWMLREERITLVTTDAPSGPLGTATTTTVRYGPDVLHFEASPRPFVLRRRGR